MALNCIHIPQSNNTDENMLCADLLKLQHSRDDKGRKEHCYISLDHKLGTLLAADIKLLEFIYILMKI